MSESARLHLQTQAGCSPSALRQVMQTLETALLETAEAWEQAGCAGERGARSWAPSMKHFWNV